MAGIPVGGGGHPVGRFGRPAVHQHVRDLFRRNPRGNALTRRGIAVFVAFAGADAAAVGGGVRGTRAERAAVAALLRRADSRAHGAAPRAGAPRPEVLQNRGTGRLGPSPHRSQLSLLQRRRQRFGAPRPPSPAGRRSNRDPPAGTCLPAPAGAGGGGAARGSGGENAGAGRVAARSGDSDGVAAVLGGARGGAVGQRSGVNRREQCCRPLLWRDVETKADGGMYASLFEFAVDCLLAAQTARAFHPQAGEAVGELESVVKAALEEVASRRNLELDL